MLTCKLDKKSCDIIGFKGAWLRCDFFCWHTLHILIKVSTVLGGCHSTAMKSVIH